MKQMQMLSIPRTIKTRSPKCPNTAQYMQSTCFPVLQDQANQTHNHLDTNSRDTQTQVKPSLGNMRIHDLEA